MTDIRHASYREWLEAYGDYYDALPGTPDVTCPNCGRKDLHIAFIADPEERIGHAHFWSEYCNFGIHISRTDVPAGVDFYEFGTPPDEISRTVPDYTMVVPTAEDDEPLEDDVTG